MPTTRILAALAALLLSAGVARAAPPTVLTYSGFLFDSAGTTPLSGVHDFYFRFFPTASGGTQIGGGSSEIQVSTTVGADGYFSVVIDVTSIANDPLFRSQMYMAVRVDTDVNAMTPRIQVSSVPSALAVPYSGITGFPAGQCGAGQFVTGYDVNGNFVCGTPTGGVTGVTAGAGLSGGGTGAVTLSANLTGAGGDNGAATTVARGDHLHDARYVQPATLSASGTLNDGGNPVDWTKLKNVPPGIADGVDSDTTYTAGSGLTLSAGQFSITSAGVTAAMLAPGAIGTAALADGSVTAAKLGAGAVGTAALANASVTFAKWASNSCAAGQVPAFNGTAWACRAGGVTSVAATAPITLSGDGAVSPTIGITRATVTDPGYVTSLDYQKLVASLSFAATNATLTGDGTTDAPLGIAGCSPGIPNMLMKWNGSAWSCDFDTDSGGTVRSVGATLNGGLVVGGSSLDPTLGIAANSVTTAMLQGTGVTAGTYQSVSVDAKGRVTGGSNPTTLAGFGIADAVQLSPLSAQTGNINVSGSVTTGGPLVVTGNVSVGANIAVSGTITGNLAAGTVVPTDLNYAVAPTTGQVPSKAATDTFTWITPLTGLTQGTGISVTGSAPSPTVAVNTTTIQARVSGSCAVGNSIRAIAADGTVTCGPSRALHTVWGGPYGLALPSLPVGVWTQVGSSIGTYTKADAGSTLRVIMHTQFYAATIPGNQVIFQIRVGGLEPTNGTLGGFWLTPAMANSDQPGTLSGTFKGLPAGNHVVSVWAVTYYSAATNVIVNRMNSSAAMVELIED